MSGKIGWYSHKQAVVAGRMAGVHCPFGPLFTGTFWWSTADGGQALVSSVHDEGEQPSWDDAHCLGPVVAPIVAGPIVREPLYVRLG